MGDLFMSLIHTCELNGADCIGQIRICEKHSKCKSACSCQPVVPLAYTVEVAAIITSGYTGLEKSRFLTSSKIHRSVRHDGHCSNSHCP
jgi:hypothetical protein